MNKNEKFVITFNRELGSGGRTVGRLFHYVVSSPTTPPTSMGIIVYELLTGQRYKKDSTLCMCLRKNFIKSCYFYGKGINSRLF